MTNGEVFGSEQSCGVFTPLGTSWCCGNANDRRRISNRPDRTSVPLQKDIGRPPGRLAVQRRRAAQFDRNGRRAAPSAPRSSGATSVARLAPQARSVPPALTRAGERSRLGCIGWRPADRTLCSARAPNTAREACALPMLHTLHSPTSRAHRNAPHPLGVRAGKAIGETPTAATGSVALPIVRESSRFRRAAPVVCAGLWLR